MIQTKIIFTEAYEDALDKIEDFIFHSSQEIAVLEWFWNEQDHALQFIVENPQIPAVHPTTGDQSWPFADGRYRIFFKHIADAKSNAVYLTHIIDNRQANLKVYPGNKMPTYDED